MTYSLSMLMTRVTRVWSRPPDVVRVVDGVLLPALAAAEQASRRPGQADR